MYKGAIEKKWNEAIAKQQADYFIKHRIWLGDDVAISPGVFKYTMFNHLTDRTTFEPF